MLRILILVVVCFCCFGNGFTIDKVYRRKPNSFALQASLTREMYSLRSVTPRRTTVGDLMNPIQTHWLTSEEAASYLNIKPATLLMWARQNKVKGFTLSGTKRHVWRFQTVDLDAMLSSPSIAPKEKI